MIPNAKTRDVQSKGVTASSSFGISMKDATHIMTILRDTLYSDKVLAVLREYSANAWDANREAGKADLPIKVIMPTSMEPTLVIQDFGPGLSQEDTLFVYTQYGASTKRDSDLAVGMLGIGSKSGFAYSDSFTVVSCHGGTRKTYVAVLDESNAGTIQLLHEEECGSETGVAIHVAVRPEDIKEFDTKARLLFQHFKPRPDINLDLPPPPTETAVLKNGAIHEHDDDWIAVMGCVPYRINLEQLRGLDPEEGLASFVYKMGGVLSFAIGEVEINASREELKYSHKTNKIIAGRLNALVEEFVRHTMDAIEKDSISVWDKRIRAQIFNRIGLPIPEAWKELTKSYLTFPLPLDTKFHLISPTSGNIVSRVTVADKFRILLLDDTRKLKGFSLGHYDIIAKPIAGVDLATLRIAVTEAIKTAKMEGVEVALLSTCSWYPVVNGVQVVRKKDKKHTVKTFVAKVGAHHHHPYSNGWDIVSRVPADDDVFVVLSKFKPDTGYDLYARLRRDKQLAHDFKKPFPAIYGYKTTAKKPVSNEDCTGTEYRTWRKGFHKAIAAVPKTAVWLSHIRWLVVDDSTSYWHLKNRGSDVTNLKELIKNLGAAHPITRMHTKIAVAKKQCRKLGRDKFDALVSLNHLLTPKKDVEVLSAEQQQRQDLLEKYPLCRSRHGVADFSKLWDEENAEHWLQYIKLVDKYEEENKDEPTIHSH